MAKTLAILVALVAAMASPVSAQQPADAKSSEGELLFREFLENEARELTIEDIESLTIKELVDVIMKVQITELLGLTKAESQVLFSKMGAQLDKIHNLKWERGALHYYLREDLKIGADEEDMERKLASSMAVEVKIAELLKTMIEQTNECLTAEQQAKLFFYTFDFENDIKKMITQAENLASQRHGPIGDKYRTKPIDPEKAPAASGEKNVTSPDNAPNSPKDERPKDERP